MTLLTQNMLRATLQWLTNQGHECAFIARVSSLVPGVVALKNRQNVRLESDGPPGHVTNTGTSN